MIAVVLGVAGLALAWFGGPAHPRELNLEIRKPFQRGSRCLRRKGEGRAKLRTDRSCMLKSRSAFVGIALADLWVRAR